MWFKYLLIILQILGAVITCAHIGKPRKPETPTGAAITVALTALMVWGILAYWPNA